MKFLGKQHQWNLLITYFPKTKSASLYIEASATVLYKCHFITSRRVAMDTLYTSMEELKQKLLRQKDISDVPNIKESLMNAEDAQILIDCINASKERDIDADYYLQKTALIGETRQLDWIVDQLGTVGVRVDKTELIPAKSSCSIS